ncbi:MAG: winged helix-turn-helix domain-containing protein [Promethearchaeota archaeon]
MSAVKGMDVSREFRPITEEKKIPPSAKVVYDLLRKNGPLTAKDILRQCDLAPRTVRYALKKLLDARMIKRLPNLNDMRQNVYQLRKVN